MMFSRILICSDDSEGALTAARMGVQIAQRFHSAVLLIHTYAPAIIASPAFEAGGWELPLVQEEIDACAEEARVILEERTGKIFQEAGVPYEALLERGHPVEVITRIAKQRGVDLIVMGSRGLNAVPFFLMGSASEGVLHHAHCPVLIARGDHAAGQAPDMQRILLASDGSEGACQATAAALEIAQKFAASLSVLNVLDASSLSYLMSPYLPTGDESPHTGADHLLAKITKEVSMDAIQAGVPRTFHQETGNPAETIVSFANRYDAGLIVVGCRGMGTFESLLLGSVSNRVAHYSRRSVLVTR